MNLSRRRLGIVRTFFGMITANLMVIAVLFCSHEYAIAVSPIESTECAETVRSSAGKAEINYEVEAERAISLCEKAIHKVPDDGDTWAFLSLAYSWAGLDSAALEANGKSIELGSVEGLLFRAYFFEYGVGVVANKLEAARWYRKAAEQGHSSAQHSLGIRYTRGEGVDQDHVEAVRWYRKAAEQGHSSAQHSLGIRYTRGEGVDQDHVEAVRWYRKAAEQGHASAQHSLGIHYTRGEGVDQDHVEAVQWFRKAVEQGHSSAQYSLGIRYARGEGVDQDHVEAVRWYRKAAEQGHISAKRAILRRINSLDSFVLQRAVEGLDGLSNTFNLLFRLVTDENVNVRSDAIEALGTLGHPHAVEPLIERLSDEDPYVRWMAAMSLGELGDRRAVEPLVATLANENSDLHRRAARSLGELGSPLAVEPLIALLNDEDYDVRWKAARSLGELGSPLAVEPLIRSLKDEDSDVREEAAQVLGELGSPLAVEPLIARLSDEDPYVRWKAARSLGVLGDPHATEALVARRNDEDVEVRWAIAFALHALGDDRTVKSLLTQLVDDKYDFVYLSYELAPEFFVNLGVSRPTRDTIFFDGNLATSALIMLRDSDATDSLVTRLNDEDSIVREDAVQALGELGSPRAVEPLITLLKDEDSYVRKKVALALGELGSPRAVEPLITLLKDEDSDVRWMAASSLSELGSLRAVEPLIRLLKDKDSFVREEAAQILGELGSPRAVEPLIRLLKDEDSYVREEAAQALGELGSPRAVEPLIRLLKDEDSDVREEAAQALGELGSLRAVEPLIRLFKDKDSSVREEAVGAIDQPIDRRTRRAVAMSLGALGDRRAVEPLIAILTDPDTSNYYIQDAVETLGTLGDRRALEPLVALLAHENTQIRLQAAGALGALGGQRALEPLVALLAHENIDIRLQAAGALGALGDSRAAELLVALLADEGSSFDWKWKAKKVLSELGDTRAIDPLLSFSTHEIWPYAIEILVKMEAFKHERVQKKVTKLFTAPALFPAVSDIDHYHRGILFCVQTIADQSTYRRRLDLLQSVWRWRYLDTTDVRAQDVDEEMQALQFSLEKPNYLNSYVLLLAAILAGNNRQFSEAQAWAERGLANSDDEEFEIRIALSIVRAEALVSLGKAREALTTLEKIQSELASQLIPNLENNVSFLPNVELLLTKVFLLSKLGWRQEVIKAGFEAEALLKSKLLGERIDGELFRRLMGMRLAPIQQEALNVEIKRYELRAQNFSDHVPRGVQEEYGGLLVAKAAVERALRSGDYDNSYRNAQQEVEKVLLRAMPQPGNVRFADDARNLAYNEWVSLQRQAADLKNEFAKLNRDQDNEKGKEDFKKLSDERVELARQVRKLKRQHPDIAARWGRAPTDLTQLQDRLDSKTGILQFLVLDQETFAILFDRDAIKIERLRIDEQDIGNRCFEAKEGSSCLGLRRLVARFRSLLRTVGAGARKNSSELVELGEAFTKVLLYPFKEFIGELDHLILVPNGSLHRLPWAALPWEDGYLIEYKTLTILPASSLFGAVVTSPEEKPAGLLALGNPIPNEPGWSDLPAAKSEVESLIEYFPTLPIKWILTGDQANRSVVVGENLQGFILHFAAHAQSGSVERTRILLSDGDLTYDDILGLNIKNAPLVVLSACDSGLGETLSGDQVYSLADAFLLSQARSVVFTLWLVDDLATMALMGEFYGNFEEGAAVALAKAQRAMIKKGHPPAHWAGFVNSEWTGAKF